MRHPSCRGCRDAAATLAGLHLLVALGACQSRPSPRSSRLAVGRATDAIALDPALRTDNESIEVAEQIFSKLVRFAAGQQEPEPDLATSWSVSSDRKRWTFNLRPGVRCHDGTPIDAEAVVFSFQRQIDASHPAYMREYAWRTTYQPIKGVTALGPLQVTFEIERPYEPFLANLAMPPAAIVCPSAFMRLGPEFKKKPVGSGPYRFVEWRENDRRIALERNPDYWDGPALTRTLVFVAIPDANERFAALESGMVDIIQQVAPGDLSLVRMHSDLRLLVVPVATVAYLAMNTSRPPFDDARIRRAVAHALPRDAITRFVYQGMAVAAVGPLPPGIWGARQDVVTYPYEPARARALLEEAGFVPNPKAPLRLLAADVARSYLPSPPLTAEIIKHSLAAIGMPVDLVLQGIGDHSSAVKKGEHDLALHGWTGDNGDPDNFLYTLLDSENAPTATQDGNNIAAYRSQRYHELVIEAQRAADRTERERLYQEAQALVATDAPWVPLAHSRNAVAVRAGVTGLVILPSNVTIYRFAEWRP